MKILTDNIGIIASFLASLFLYSITLSISYTKMVDRIKSLEKRVTDTEHDIKTMNPIWVQVLERLASIETTLKFLTKEK